MARCKHKWEVIRQIDIYRGSEYPYRIIYLLCCTECGKIKKVRIK